MQDQLALVFQRRETASGFLGPYYSTEEGICPSSCAHDIEMINGDLFIIFTESRNAVVFEF